MVELVPEIHKKILLRLNVRDLIRCKSVCKSWQSLISENRFIKDHLNPNVDEFRRRMTGKAVFPIVHRKYDSDLKYYIVGYSNSNGLVCISNLDGEIIVANPSTREMRTLPRPGKIIKFTSLSNCWGFGYDTSTDDYKVVLGFITKRKGVSQACFTLQVFSLKLNVWKVIEKVNYISNSGSIYYKVLEHCRVGVLCNGSLHWVIKDRGNREVVFSFDLSTEEFKEIPQLDYVARKGPVLNDKILSLGIMDECLCIYHHGYMSMMTKYNEKHSWKTLEHYFDYAIECVEVDFLKEVAESDIIAYESLRRNDVWLFGNHRFKYAPKVVQSLVSPHLK